MKSLLQNNQNNNKRRNQKKRNPSSQLKYQKWNNRHPRRQRLRRLLNKNLQPGLHLKTDHCRCLKIHQQQRRNQRLQREGHRLRDLSQPLHRGQGLLEWAEEWVCHLLEEGEGHPAS
jgi:hypothetical protein